MIYRQWPLRRKIAYWLVLALLATAPCLLLVNDGLGTSSASPPQLSNIPPGTPMGIVAS